MLLNFMVPYSVEEVKHQTVVKHYRISMCLQYQNAQIICHSEILFLQIHIYSSSLVFKQLL